MYETPQGLYGTVWHSLGHGGFFDFLLTEKLEPITIEHISSPQPELIVEQSGPDLWTIV
jgi:hypothetical protein